MSIAADKRKKQVHVSKALARPKRSIEKRDEDHAHGLWVDHEVLRKHLSSQQPRFFLPQESIVGANNRYLELADVALRNTERKYARKLVEFKRKAA